MCWQLFIVTSKDLHYRRLYSRAAARCPERMGVDHRVDRGTSPPHFLKWGDVVFCPPPLFGTTNTYNNSVSLCI